MTAEELSYEQAKDRATEYESRVWSSPSAKLKAGSHLARYILSISNPDAPAQRIAELEAQLAARGPTREEIHKAISDALSGDEFGSAFGRKDAGPLDSEQVELIVETILPLIPTAPAATAQAVTLTDITTLERLAGRMEQDAKNGGLNIFAVRSIADIIRRAIGAPLMWPAREAGARAADDRYPGSPNHRLAFNEGVKWAVENYQPSTEIDRLTNGASTP